MGYACPVCDTPQADATHLANHLAFTAMLGDEAHEDWLDEHAPGWSEEGERELAARVGDEAEEREFPQVFEDTTDPDRHRSGPRPGDLFEDESGLDRGGVAAGRGGAPGSGQVDPETEAIYEEARELTERRRADRSADEAGAGEANEERETDGERDTADGE